MSTRAALGHHRAVALFPGPQGRGSHVEEPAHPADAVRRLGRGLLVGRPTARSDGDGAHRGGELEPDGRAAGPTIAAPAAGDGGDDAEAEPASGPSGEQDPGRRPVGDRDPHAVGGPVQGDLEVGAGVTDGVGGQFGRQQCEGVDIQLEADDGLGDEGAGGRGTGR